jgi:nitronate monooxygenase
VSENLVSEDLPTAFTELVGCRFPIQLAVMGGGVGTPELAAAVSGAGGLGMLSASFPQAVSAQIGRVMAETDQPFGVGFFAFDLAAKAEEVELAARRARVVEVFWGWPDPVIIERIHVGGALALWQVGSRDEALAAADAGCDAVVAQGLEAGGHVRGTTPLHELLDQVVPSVTVPVVAAGGIATGRSMSQALVAGAAAVRVGTRLVATAESGAHPDYIAALIAADAPGTVYTTAFDAGWPDAPHRVLRACLDAAGARSTDIVGKAKYGERSWDVLRWSAQPPANFVSGDVGAMAMYAGTGVGDINDIASAAEVIHRMVSEAKAMNGSGQ